MTTFDYKIELSDFKRAAWLHMKPRKGFAIAGMGLLILVLVAFVIAGHRAVTSGKDLKVVLILGGVMTYLCFWFFVAIPRSLARTYQQQKLLHETYTVEISDTHLVTKSQNGVSHLSWDVFHKWKTDNTLVLLYQSDALYHIFPCRAFPSMETFEMFKSLLTTKLGPPHV